MLFILSPHVYTYLHMLYHTSLPTPHWKAYIMQHIFIPALHPHACTPTSESKLMHRDPSLALPPWHIAPPRIQAVEISYRIAILAPVWCPPIVPRRDRSGNRAWYSGVDEHA